MVWRAIVCGRRIMGKKQGGRSLNQRKAMEWFRVIRRDQRGIILKDLSRRLRHEERHFLKNGAVSKKRVPRGSL